MSSLAMKWALGLLIEDGAMKPVLTHLAWLHSDTSAPFPSQQTLAQATGNSERTVREALRVLEFFNVIHRKPRSNGARGRSSDAYTLAIGLPFDLTRDRILAARIGLRNRRKLPVATDARQKSQPAKTAIATGELRQGIGDEQKYPTQGSITQDSQSALRPGGRNSTLRVVNGGRV